MRLPRNSALAVAALTAAAACGASEPPPLQRLRLWAEGRAELVEAPPPGAAELVYAADFEAELSTWRAIVNPGRGPGGLVAATRVDDGRTALELRGTHGGLQRVVAVEPNTCYALKCSVRVSGIEPAAPDFDGARLWLAEATAEVPFEEFRTTRTDLMRGNWTSPSAFGHAGWLALRHTFVTSAETHVLQLVCSLATASDVRSGTVEFADLRLERLARGAWWREVLAAEVAQRRGIEGTTASWQHARLVSAELEAEHRPAFVLLPEERLRFALPQLAPGARLSFGAGLFRPSATPGDGRATLRVSSDGTELLAQSFAPPASPADSRWEPCEVALPPGARTLEFALAADAPFAVGAPLVRTAEPRPAGPNVLLVSIDTLRADRVGAYGNPGGLTPNLDRLAQRGLLCRDASASAPYTLPSHTTLLTGQFPSVHGVVKHERTLSAARSTPLAERLARAGYATQAFTAGGFVNAVFGLDRGFDGFASIDPIREPGSHFFRTLVAKYGPALAERLLAEHGFAAVENWLRTHRDERFFLFLHTYTVHDYDAPRAFLNCEALGCPRPRVVLRTTKAEDAAAFTPEMRAHVQHLYEAAVRYTDERLGRLFAELAELGLDANTLVVVTSDHGEEFFEHGALEHGRTLYEELLRVPLVLAGPGVPARELTRPAMLVDVVPTLLARLGLPPAENVQGVDLLGPDWPERSLWSEVDSRFAHKYALREEQGWKTIHGPPAEELPYPNARAWELYDLARDPHEEHDLAPAEAARLAAGRARLERTRAALEELGRSLGSLGEGELGAGTLEELDQLGYGGE